MGSPNAGIAIPRRSGSRLSNPQRRKRREPWERKAQDADGAIAFIGVWDTVDAIGLPFDEPREWCRKLKLLPHHAHELNDSVKAAFHALAIDDERQTFHPLLFDKKECDEKECDESRQVEQVWFAGAHSNVGGGYPKDQIAYISLAWMMRNAADPDLYSGYVPLRIGWLVGFAGVFGLLL